MTPIEFIFDFASPNAYLVHKVVPELKTRSGAPVIYTPCLLGGIFKLTNNQAPMIAFANIANKMAYEQLETRRFIDRFGLHQFTMNPHFPVNTLLVMRAAIVAERDGILMPYVETVMQAMWEGRKKMDDPQVAHGVLKEAGFDADRLLQGTQDPAVKQTLVQNTDRAVERGAFGIPTFFVGTEMFYGKERLGQVEEAARAG
ncbi:MAG: 2-hydroxychromene-2-carboxylate isomerase [Alphaproteobacteria bacterium]